MEVLREESSYLIPLCPVSQLLFQCPLQPVHTWRSSLAPVTAGQPSLCRAGCGGALGQLQSTRSLD
jgi:hypothetical protein